MTWTVEATLSEARGEVAGRMAELTDKVLDVFDEMLEYRYDGSLKLRAAIALLQVSGIGPVMSTGPPGGLVTKRRRSAMGQ